MRCVGDIVTSMKVSGLIQNGGLATTNVRTEQQWDFDSAWAPLVCLWVDGLYEHGGCDGWRLAQSLGSNFLAVVVMGLDGTGNIWEKYCTSERGACSRGGEYECQKGFGWTNGTVLHFALKLGIAVMQ